MKSLICLILSFVMIFCLVACSDNSLQTQENSDSVSEQDNRLTDELLWIVQNGASDYIIIYPSGANASTLYFAAKSLSEEIKSKTGAELKYTYDYEEESEYEILIGATKREESPSCESFESELDWSISLSGKKIIIAGGSDQAVADAVIFFSEQYLKEGELSVPTSLNYTYHSEYNALKLAEIYDNVKITGRHFINDAGITCDWSAAGIEFNAVCKGTVKLKLSATRGDAYFAVYVDGVRSASRLKAPKGECVIELAQNLSEGMHNIRLVKMNYNMNSNTVLQELILNGNVAEKPADKETYIEFIGASVLGGFGLSDTPSRGDDGSDATYAFSYVCAEALDADYSMVSVSGHTLAWSTSDPTKSVPYQYYPYVNKLRDSTPYDFAGARKPDAVVINLGNNDENLYTSGKLNISSTVFEQDLRAFIEQLRTYYPADTPIVFLTNNMGDGYQDIIASVCTDLGGESSGYYVYKSIRDNDALGNHPDREASRIVGEALAQFLKNKNLIS